MKLRRAGRIPSAPLCSIVQKISSSGPNCPVLVTIHGLHARQIPESMTMLGNAVRRGETDSRTSASEIMSVPQASDFLGVHRNTLYKLIQEGEIPALRLTKGGRWKFRRAELEQWLEDRQARSTK